MNRLTYRLFHRKKTIATIYSLGLSVVDHKNILRPHDIIRNIELNGGSNGRYSSIFINCKHKIQPYLPELQRAFIAWNMISPINNVLVLGCAGCSFPRFFILSDKNCTVTGIEYSQEMIDVAKKYFLADIDMERFNLIKADAYQWIIDNKNTHKYDAILVDLFIGKRQSEINLQEDFLKTLSEAISDNGLVAFNVYDNTTEIRRMLNEHFEWISVANMNGKPHYILCSKQSNQEHIKNFKETYNNIKIRG